MKYMHCLSIRIHRSFSITRINSRKPALIPAHRHLHGQEAEEYGNQLDIQENGDFERIGFYPLIGAGNDVWMVNALGENYITEDGEVNINTPPVQDTFEWILGQKEKYGENTITSINSQFENAQQDPFMSGKISMMVQNANYYVELRDFAQDMNFGV